MGSFVRRFMTFINELNIDLLLPFTLNKITIIPSMQYNSNLKVNNRYITILT